MIIMLRHRVPSLLVSKKILDQLYSKTLTYNCIEFNTSFKPFNVHTLNHINLVLNPVTIFSLFFGIKPLSCWLMCITFYVTNTVWINQKQFSFRD